MYYSKIYDRNTGFTNQIFSLITTIIIAHNNNEKCIIVDKFLNDINHNSFTPISEIFNIEKINEFLKNTYNIVIIDKNNIQFNINYIKYGTDDINIDLTKHYTHNTHNIFIDKNTNFNLICGDPCFGIKKNVFINYTINNYTIQEQYNEKLDSDIDFIFNNKKYVFNFKWIYELNINMFENILTHIYFNDSFMTLKDNLLDQIIIQNNINVIHLRLEDDAIKHWSKMNTMTEHDFKNYLENKYIDIIKKYININDQNIILSSSLHNPVIDFLNNNNYKLFFSPKNFNFREKNAIVDLLKSTYCNNIFIGNFNPLKLNGSTFSYYISKLIDPKCKLIMLDPDRIKNDEIVH